MTVLTPEQKRPTNIEVDIKQSQVRITWGDDYKSVYSFEDLRDICPCAVCKELHGPAPETSALQPEVKAELLPDRPVEMVGNYALQFFWVDGHNSGIYGFDYLRSQSL
jgi:DUF971 family protein